MDTLWAGPSAGERTSLLAAALFAILSHIGAHVLRGFAQEVERGGDTTTWMPQHVEHRIPVMHRLCS
ncbi:hypothetical protein MPTK1_4g07770 [Marchantia polymorpha subsp. ruderalis]|nr:hypothetical protein MARPO_0115s0003 [Marchantia polymorpha]BBN07977.1 hypothetical protein Mp_4g07770 [Marchantia polymorpha subsp. ruderalis]|eukprot:PTQ31075.1 hypothetical protein MARPO_0115s0003 [Marchantia polymorpha]